MTPEERARKISYQFNGRDFQTLDEGRIRELLIEKIAAQIVEAEREAYEKGRDDEYRKLADRLGDRGFSEYKAGFAAAKAKAKGLFFPGDYIAEKYAIELIEKMKP